MRTLYGFFGRKDSKQLGWLRFTTCQTFLVRDGPISILERGNTAVGGSHRSQHSPSAPSYHPIWMSNRNHTHQSTDQSTWVEPAPHMSTGPSNRTRLRVMGAASSLDESVCYLSCLSCPAPRASLAVVSWSCAASKRAAHKRKGLQKRTYTHANI